VPLVLVLLLPREELCILGVADACTNAARGTLLQLIRLTEIRSKNRVVTIVLVLFSESNILTTFDVAFLSPISL